MHSVRVARENTHVLATHSEIQALPVEFRIGTSKQFQNAVNSMWNFRNFTYATVQTILIRGPILGPPLAVLRNTK